MRICLVTPAPAHSYHGNRVTAVCWADILRGQGHEVAVAQDHLDQPADLLVALHARRSAESLRRFRARHADAPVVLALTGTDLYLSCCAWPWSKRSRPAALLSAAAISTDLQELAILNRPHASCLQIAHKRLGWHLHAVHVPQMITDHLPQSRAVVRTKVRTALIMCSRELVHRHSVTPSPTSALT